MPAQWRETSETGWISSNGQLSADGIAKELNRCTDDGNVTFTFFCEGQGECYIIDGEELIINHEPGPVTGNCPMIQITEKPEP